MKVKKTITSKDAVGAQSNGKYAIFTRYKSHLLLTFAPMVSNGCSGKDCVLAYPGSGRL
jgi:hypothetical protein